MKEGGFAHFEARLEPMGDHTMKVEWFKDGKPVEASSRYEIIEWHFFMAHIACFARLLSFSADTGQPLVGRK